jgi:hypothetical protein
MTKVVRTIDRRNALFGAYKYQVKPGSMPNTQKVRNWCREKWGTPRIWVEEPVGNGSFRCYSDRNPRWTEIKRPGFSTPFIYIRDEADAVMFGLVWAV